MWLVAGLLLGFVLLSSLIGFHTGPHTHLAAGVFGILAAAWLIVMVVQGRSLSVLLVLLVADLVVSAGVGMLAWKGLTTRSQQGLGRHLNAVEGAEGTAQTDLDPSGIVRVHGENWSADCVNGAVKAGTPVQVIKVNGVRLEVWAEQPSTDGAAMGQLKEKNAWS